jgi:hypothetical protein
VPIRRTVIAGDSVISLSDEHGFFAGTIWNYPENQEIRQLRPDMNVLMPGDVVVIPDLRERLEKRPTGAKYRFRRKGIPAMFRLQIFDQNLPRANQPFQLKAGTYAQSGQTDSKGIVSCFIPARALEGELRVGQGADEVVFALQFSHLEPLSETSGIQQRLTNLGYDCGPGTGEWNDQSRAALCAFQRNHGLKVTGECDAATRSRIEEVHDDPFDYPNPEAASS